MFSEKWKKEIITIPNILSLLRIALIPVYAAIPVIAVLCFICCAVTTKILSLLPGSQWIVG